MVKPLTFKGDKKPKKRKRAAAEPSGADQDADSANPERQLKAAKPEDAEPEQDDSWVSADAVTDISGPVMFVLPSEPPTALACDAAGKVFTLPIENIIDGNPLTAEPHDVRQVWIANKIVGTDHFRFKGAHGKSAPLLRQTRPPNRHIRRHHAPRILPPPTHPPPLYLPTPDPARHILLHPPRSSKPNAPPDVRGDETETTFNTTFRVRMQARFKPRHKANKEEKAREKISRKELEEAAGRRLEEEEIFDHQRGM
ncbi:hypothetical protein N0V88_004205 [Collariella sp. IMI 366227]|nr:hypothetical protein N0V88_004205 [Collariella sp. IMI 366227]